MSDHNHSKAFEQITTFFSKDTYGQSRVFKILSWPHLPAHMFMGILLISCMFSAVLGYAPYKWILVCSSMWGAYLLALLFAERIAKTEFQYALQSLITIFLIFSLYLLLADLAFAVIPWDADKFLSSIDTFIFFGHSPVLRLSNLASPPIVELFSIAYGTFIPYLYFSIFICLLGGHRKERKMFVTAFAITYAVSFLGYLFMPAKGPVVSMMHEFHSTLSGGYFHGIILDAIEKSGGPHGAFPSLHIGASWFICYFDIRRGQLRGVLYLPLVICIFVATMILRYHYFIDLLAGLFIASFAVIASERIHGVRSSKKPLIPKIFLFILRHFFGNIQADDLVHLPENKPILLVSNHLNAFIDPFVISAATRRSLRITAKAALRKNPLLNPLAFLLRAIPLTRAEDSSDKGYRVENQSAFRTCFKALDHNEVVCIFPEGKSHSEPCMLPLKSGAARIALEYAHSTENGNQLCIVPAGIYYSDKSRFGSQVYVNIGTPIDVAEWIKQNANCGHKCLTLYLKERIEDLTVQAKSREDLSLLAWLSELYQHFNVTPVSVDYISKIPKNFITVTRYFIRHYYKLIHKPEILHLKTQAKILKTELDAFGINVKEIFLPMHFRKALFFLFRELEIFMFGALLFTIGLVVNIVPLCALLLLVRCLSSDEDHWATNYIFYASMLMGLWWIGIVVISILYSPWLLSLIALSVFGGYFATQYAQRFTRTHRRLRTFLIFLFQPRLQMRLIEKQTQLINALMKIDGTYIDTAGGIHEAN